MSPCGPGHYIGSEEGEMLQCIVDHANQAHSRAVTPHPDCEVCHFQGQYEDLEHITVQPGESIIVDVNRISDIDGDDWAIEPVDVDVIGLSLEGLARGGN